MKHPASRELFAYWNWLRAGRAAPERSDIDPADIRGILAETFMVEIIEADAPVRQEMPVRLSGTRINALFGEDVRGWSFLSLWRGADQERLMRLVAETMDGTTPAIAGSLAGPAGQVPLALELLILPLRHHGKTHARFLGALSPQAVPLWLGLTPVQPLTLTSQRFIDPAREPVTWTPPASAERRVVPPRPRQALRERRAHLVVYEGGKSDRIPKPELEGFRPR